MISIDYGTYNSWKDWGLVLINKHIGKPQVITKYDDLPSVDGASDGTEALGGPYYGLLNISHTFQTREKIKGIPVERLMFVIEDAIHGKHMEIKEHGDEYHWTGRIETSFEFDDDGSMEVKIEAECEPYRKNSAGARRL